jgi:hypothetical protein
MVAFLVVAVAIAGCSGGGSKSAADSESSDSVSDVRSDGTDASEASDATDGSDATDASDRSDSAGSDATEATDGSDASSGKSAPSSKDPVLKKVALRNSDLSGGASFELIPGGDKVAGQITMDFCAGDYPSEALRSTRFQQAALDRDDNVVVNNENVTYKSADGARQALDEVRTVFQLCPRDQFRPSKAPGLEFKFNFQAVPDDQLGPVAADHVALAGEISVATGESEPAIYTFQRRGKVVVAVYGADLASVKPFLAIAATRLAALTPAEAGE